VPDDFSRDEAVEQIVYFLNVVADAADQTDLVIAIEPLNRKESNIINSVAEGVEIAKKVNRPKIRVLADFYHMDEDNEPISHIVECKDWLAHVHVADTGRGAPGTGQYPYQEFAAALREAGYDGLVSIECRWDDFAAEAPPAVEFLRRVFS
jgi:sugar phosphate isomerase/epimerase